MTRARAHALAGAVLSLGAPLGLLALRAGLAGVISLDWVLRELARDALTYGYVTTTTLPVLALFGYVLGRRADSLYSSSATDALTGLANRRAFEQRLTHEYARARRYGTSLSLLIADLDGLKSLNDSQGHRAGDAALREVAAAIARNLRASDLGARWGGDEFSVLAPSTSAAEAASLAERVRAMAEEGFPGMPPITLSVGVASLDPAADQSLEALLRAADAALYAAKTLGRNRVVSASPER